MHLNFHIHQRPHHAIFYNRAYAPDGSDFRLPALARFCVFHRYHITPLTRAIKGFEFALQILIICDVQNKFDQEASNT